MKKMNLTIRFSFLLCGLLALVFSACKKYNEWEVDESKKRLFRPTGLISVVDGVTVTLRWKAKPGTESYTIELSKDSLQFSSIVKTYDTGGEKDADGIFFIIPESLESETRYSARIKAKSSEVPESDWAAVTFLTLTEQIMYGVDIADLAPRAATLRWMIPNEVTHFMINGVRYDISAGEKSAGEKLIDGLTPKTAYTADLYNNASIRGKQTFTTKADIPTGPNVIEVGTEEDLAALLAGPINNGTIFVLLQGSVYKTDNGITLPDGASFTIWGEDGPEKPVLAFNGITLPANAGTVKFENIDLTGYQDNDPGASKRNYIFNQSAASNTGEIIFENCIVRNFANTPLRLQGANAISIGKVVMNKCIVYDIGDNNANGTYAMIHTNVATGKFDNIELTNSTFYKIGYGLILHNAVGSQSVKIENCTFDNTVGNGRYFIDYNAQPAGTFLFSNNIFGKTLSPTSTARGIRASGAPIVSNSYLTTDAVISNNAIPDMIQYDKASTDLFTDPAAGNFLIKDNTFTGKATSGDPRWR